MLGAYDVMVTAQNGRREKKDGNPMGRWVICVVAIVHVAGIGIQRQTVWQPLLRSPRLLGGMQTMLLESRRLGRQLE